MRDSTPLFNITECAVMGKPMWRNNTHALIPAKQHIPSFLTDAPLRRISLLSILQNRYSPASMRTPVLLMLPFANNSGVPETNYPALSNAHVFSDGTPLMSFLQVNVLESPL